MKLLSYNELELFYFELKISWILAGKLRHSCQNFTCVSRLRLQVNYSFKNWANFLALFVFWWIQLRFWLNFFRQGFWRCTLPARRSFRGKIFGMRVFFSILQPFSDLSEKFQVLWRQLCCSFVKGALFPRAKQNEGKIVLKKPIKP